MSLSDKPELEINKAHIEQREQFRQLVIQMAQDAQSRLPRENCVQDMIDDLAMEGYDPRLAKHAVFLSQNNLSNARYLLKEHADVIKEGFEQLDSIVNEILQRSESKEFFTPIRSDARRTFSEAAKQKVNLDSESFTVSVGSQIKMSQNLRLSVAEPRDFFSLDLKDEYVLNRSQILSTLYSSNLSALVLFIGDNHSSELFNFCDQRNDLHFDNLKEQIKSVKQTRKLLNGDVIVTEHSNLFHHHIVFHINSSSHNITSQSPVLLALKHIVRNCFQYNVNLLSIPLPKKMQDAELVMKSIKGNLVENSRNWKRSNIVKTIEFMTLREDFDTVRSNLVKIFNAI